MGKIELTAEHALSFKSVSDAQIAPDGKIIAFVVGDGFKADSKLPKANIWVVSSTGGQARQFTYGLRSDTAPRWSPDGKTLAFLSDREEDGRRQVYLSPRDGGEAKKLTKAAGDIPSPRSLNPLAWSPDGKRIAVLVTDPKTDEEKRRIDEKNDAIVFERDPKYTRIHVFDVATGEIEFVSPRGLQIWEFCWSPGDKEFAVVCSDLPWEQAWYTCRLAIVSMNDGLERTLHRSERQVAKPVWSPDGGSIAFLSSNWSDRGINGGSAYVVSLDCEVSEVSAGHVASVFSVAWSDGSDKLLTAAHERGGVGLAEIELSTGERTSLWTAEASLATSGTSFSRDRCGNIALVREDVSSPQDVWLARPDTGGLMWTQLTKLHPQAVDTDLVKVNTIHWQGADGWEIQGFLLHPLGSSAGPAPMVTEIHGGPTGMASYSYFSAKRYYGLLAARGFAVFIPNYRGSTGWGLEFAESNIGDMGGKDWEDIQKGIDHCVSEGIADPERLGITGGSYGGFMSAWAVTQTDRFKAAVMAAGISDWRSFHGRSYLCDWDVIHYGGADPWDPDGTYRKFSPITHVKNVKTPTLIIHGEVDRDVPVEQSYLFYRALKDLEVETDLVIYPREPHGFGERNHILDANRRTVDWFVEHL